MAMDRKKVIIHSYDSSTRNIISIDPKQHLPLIYPGIGENHIQVGTYG
jgi:hypothetical protein